MEPEKIRYGVKFDTVIPTEKVEDFKQIMTAPGKGGSPSWVSDFDMSPGNNPEEWHIRFNISITSGTKTATEKLMKQTFPGVAGFRMREI